MNGDLDLDERRAAALPRDHVLDFPFHGGYERNTCGRCLNYFRGFVSRTLCRQCQDAEESVDKLGGESP